MKSNLNKYKDDLELLIIKGIDLHNAIQFECFPDEFKKEIKKVCKTDKDFKKFIKSIPSFKSDYQEWYSEAKVIVKLLLPERFDDFGKYYEKPKNRKETQYGNYVIEDYLQSLSITRGWQKEKVVGPSAAIPQFEQQLNILKSVQRRFESSLFDIIQLAQADLFDSEIETSKELAKNGFLRAAGAIAGVILEKHLSQICLNHKILIKKKNPTIGDFNDNLKNNGVIDTPEWRRIQYLGDVRNLCDHNKRREPKREEITDLIDGVERILKNLF